MSPANRDQTRKAFCWVLLVGASWEFLAFLMKALGARDQQNVGYAAPAQLLFLLAPLCKSLHHQPSPSPEPRFDD